MARQYEQKKRAEQQEETRRRIVEAAVSLHQSVGVLRTTVTEIAEKAGVSRLTVYRHFPDELTLVQACSGLYWDRNPFPDPDSWKTVTDPRERFRQALRESYAYHRLTEPMMGRALAEAGNSPVMKPYHECWNRAAEVVTSAWTVPARQRHRLRAAVGHALAFPTWRSLVRDEGLTDEQAVELMLRLVP